MKAPEPHHEMTVALCPRIVLLTIVAEPCVRMGFRTAFGRFREASLTAILVQVYGDKCESTAPVPIPILALDRVVHFCY